MGTLIFFYLLQTGILYLLANAGIVVIPATIFGISGIGVLFTIGAILFLSSIAMDVGYSIVAGIIILPSIKATRNPFLIIIPSLLAPLHKTISTFLIFWGLAALGIVTSQTESIAIWGAVAFSVLHILTFAFSQINASLTVKRTRTLIVR